MSGRVRTNALVLLGYVAVAFAYFGWRLVLHPGRYILGSGRDPQIFIWAFAWWPHAVETWQNPFYSHAIYAPDGKGRPPDPDPPHKAHKRRLTGKTDRQALLWRLERAEVRPTSRDTRVPPNGERD